MPSKTFTLFCFLYFNFSLAFIWVAESKVLLVFERFMLEVLWQKLSFFFYFFPYKRSKIPYFLVLKFCQFICLSIFWSKDPFCITICWNFQRKKYFDFGPITVFTHKVCSRNVLSLEHSSP